MSTQQKLTRYMPIFILVGLLAFGIGLYTQSMDKFDPNQMQGTWLNEPRAVSPFQIDGPNGEKITEQSLKGQWTIMFFGFSHCGAMCPLVLTNLQKTYAILQAKQVDAPKMVMVSVDPKRDTPDRMGDYVKSFNIKFEGAVPSPEQLKAMSTEFGIVYTEFLTDQSKQHYDIDHSGTLLLFNPKGQLNAFFSYPQDANQVANDLIYIMGHA